MPPPSYEQWLDWLFTGPEPDFEQLWDPVLDRPVDWQLDHATTMFQSPAFLLYAYPEDVVRAGLWRLPFAWDLRDLIWNQDVRWERRRACVEAMYGLFTDLFPRNTFDDTCFMWWDLYREFGSDPDPRVAETQVSVLARVLALPNADCQLAALHGLGHLHTASRLPVVQAYLERSDLPQEARAYGQAALEGKVL
jgi:hypothetical protein